jgi:integrase/recombinase XerC
MTEPMVIEQDPSTTLRCADTGTLLQVPFYVSGENVPLSPDPAPLVGEMKSLEVRHEQTIDDLLEQFAKWMRFEVADGAGCESTIKYYLADIRQHLMWLAKQGLKPVMVTDHVVMEYRRYLVELYKISTAGRKLTSVRRFYDIAHARGMLPTNPAARVKSPADRTEEEERIKYISRLAMQKMLVLSDEQYKHDANSKVKALRDRAMLLLTMRHGLREIELIRANVESLDLKPTGEGSTLRVFGKRNKFRTIHLVPQTQAAIEKWLAAHAMMHIAADDGDGRSPAGTPLFVSLHWGGNGQGGSRDGRKGKRLCTRGVRSMIDGYLKAVGAKAEGISGHALRHAFGTWAMFGGADLQYLSKEMGHGDISTTTKYRGLVDRMNNNPSKYLEFMETPLPQDEVVAIVEKQKKNKTSHRASAKVIGSVTDKSGTGK